MMRIKGWLIKAWRKILTFFTAGALVCALVVIPCFAADPAGTAIVSGPADGQPFIFGENVLSIVDDPARTSFNYKWTNNDTTGGSGTYSKGSTTYFPGSGSYAMYSGNFTKFSHTFSDNIGYQISGVLNSPYNISGLPYYENAERYGVKFAFFFGGGNTSITTANGNVWLTCTLRFFDASDTRLGDVYQLVPVPSLNMFFFQSANLPAFTSKPSYITLTFSGYGDSTHQLELSPVYFSPLVWSAVKGDPVVNVDLELPNPTPPPEFVDVTNNMNNAISTAAPIDVSINSTIASAANVDTSFDASGIAALQPSLLALKNNFDTWWYHNDNAFRRLVFFFVGVSLLTTMAGIGINIVNKSKG